MKTLQALSAIFFIGLLTACASTPATRYYLLEPAAGAVNASDGISVGLHPVVVPEYLRRSALLTDAGGSTLNFSSEGRWGEPLADGIYRVSAIDLAALLKTGQWRTWPWSESPTIEVRIAVLSLVRDTNQALLTADVQLMQRGEKGPRRSHFLKTWQQTPRDASDIATAEAYSALVQAMNRDIFNAIEAM